MCSRDEEYPTYHIMGTFTGWEPRPMAPVDDTVGKFKYRFAMDGSERYRVASPVADDWYGQDKFQICVGGDISQMLYPECGMSAQEHGDVRGPGGNADGKHWRIVARMFSSLEVILDVCQEDLSRVVSWSELPLSRLTNLLRGERSNVLTFNECREAQGMLLQQCSTAEFKSRLENAEAAAGNDRQDYLERLHACLLKTVYPEIAAHFGYADVADGARWITASMSIHRSKKIVEQEQDILALQRNFESIERNKIFLESGAIPKGPHGSLTATPSWNYIWEQQDPGERRRSSHDGVHYTLAELTEQYANQMDDVGLATFWDRQCIRAALAVSSDTFDVVGRAEAAVEYRVLQRSLVKKIGVDPMLDQTVEITREVGSTVFTTGRTWSGKEGAQWVELDCIVEKPGWLMLGGVPGFGPPGPHLLAEKPGDPPLMVLTVDVPGQAENAGEDEDITERRNIVLSSVASVRDAKEWIALIFGFEPKHIILGEPHSGLKPSGGDTFNPRLLRDDKMLLQKVGFKDGGHVPYCYVGNAAKGFEGKVPTWEGKLAGTPYKSVRRPDVHYSSSPSDKKAAKLQGHFEALGLPASTSHDQIKRQYRKLALAFHPDKHPHDVEGATAAFQHIKSAYEALREGLGF